MMNHLIDILLHKFLMDACQQSSWIKPVLIWENVIRQSSLKKNLNNLFLIYFNEYNSSECKNIYIRIGALLWMEGGVRHAEVKEKKRAIEIFVFHLLLLLLFFINVRVMPSLIIGVPRQQRTPYRFPSFGAQQRGTAMSMYLWKRPEDFRSFCPHIR